MNQRDMRPPFAALGGTIPPELEKLPTPCYLLDEDALTRNAEILGGLASAPAARCCWPKRRSAIMTATPCWRHTWPVPKPAACLKPAWVRKRCPARKSMYSARPTVRTKWMNWCNTRTISSLTPPPSWRSSALPQKRQAKAWGCASTRNAPPRTATLFMTPAPPAAALAPPAPSGTPQ